MMRFDMNSKMRMHFDFAPIRSDCIELRHERMHEAVESNRGVSMSVGVSSRIEDGGESRSARVESSDVDSNYWSVSK